MELTHSDLEQIADLVAERVLDNMRQTPGKWLTLKEAKEHAKVKATSTIMSWINEGYIYAFKRSGEWVVDRESIDDWFNSGRLR